MVECLTPEREVGGLILLGLPCCVLEQDTFTSQKELVIPRKRLLSPDMTEKLFTGTLNKNEMKSSCYPNTPFTETPWDIRSIIRGSRLQHCSYSHMEQQITQTGH